MEARSFCRTYPQPGDEVHPGAIVPCYKPKDHEDKHTWECAPVPAMKDYVVVQERRVKVRAENPTHAIEIAKPVFDAGHVDSSYPDVIGDPVETSIEAREDF